MSYAIITGASKGIGKAIALLLAERKYDLVLVARNQSELSKLATEVEKKYKVSCKFLSADLSTENGIQSTIQFVQKNILDCSILVNNAGYAVWGRFDTTESSKLTAMMDVNMRAPMLITNALLPLLKKQKQSYILNIASTAAYQAVPTLAVYAASKSFMLLFSRALQYELKKSNVSVTVVSPGATDTNFMKAAGMTTPKMIKQGEKFNMKPAEVAEFAVSGMFEKKNEIIPGFINQISVFMTRFVPKALTEKIAAGLYE